MPGCHLLFTTVALFAPGITVIMVPPCFPEPGFVVIHKLQGFEPLGALPELEMGHKQTGWAAMDRRNIVFLVSRTHKGLLVDDIGNRQIRGITTI